MRQLALSNKPLRGISRRLRALERWTSSFRDEFYPRKSKINQSLFPAFPVELDDTDCGLIEL